MPASIKINLDLLLVQRKMSLTELSEEEVNREYPEDYTHGSPISLDEVLQGLDGGPRYDF